MRRRQECKAGLGSKLLGDVAMDKGIIGLCKRRGITPVLDLFIGECLSWSFSKVVLGASSQTSVAKPATIQGDDYSTVFVLPL